MREVMLYSPDKGAGFGQALRARRVRQAFEAVQHFLTHCTIASPLERIRLIAYRATEWDEDSVAEACIERTIAHFGPPDREEGGGTRWPSGEPVKGGSLQWDGTAATVGSIVDFLIAGEPWPRQTLGPVDLSFSVSFQWRHPTSGEVLFSQESGHATHDGSLRSTLLVTLGRRPFIQPDLWFPYPEGAPGLREFLEAVQSYLPFELLPRHFRVATPQRDGQGYRFRKLVIPPFVAV